jgi:hypothetical protein
MRLYSIAKYSLHSNFQSKTKLERDMVAGHEQLAGGGEDLSLVLPDPVVLELNRMHNLLKGLSLPFSVSILFLN